MIAPEPYSIKPWPLVAETEEEKHRLLDELQELVEKCSLHAAQFRRNSEPPTLESVTNGNYNSAGKTVL